MDTVQRASLPVRSSGSGFRKITPAMLGVIQKSKSFEITESRRPGQVLAAFKAAAPYLGIGASIVHAIDFFFALTQPIDWQPGARPIVWPSAAMQENAMCLGSSQIKRLNRRLVELGLVVMKDSPNGKRYGRRARPNGPIIEAYGFDLSPLADRMAEFEAIAEEGRAARIRLAALRRRASIARKGLKQLEETAAQEGIIDIDWASAWTKVQAIKTTKQDLLELVSAEIKVEQLESLESEIRELMIGKLAQRKEEKLASSVEKNPKPSLNEPHITTTNQLINPKDTVSTLKRCSRDGLPGQTTQTETLPRRNRSDLSSALKLTPDELIRLAPRLVPYLRHPSPSWPEIVEAADWLRQDLGVSKPLWGEACLAMGREQAAIAIALVSAKPPSHFRSSPGGYFHGMVERARGGDLYLGRTIWGLRGANSYKN